MNRALDGDTVVVRLLPRSEWARTDGGLAERGKADGAEADDDIGVADPAGAHVASGDFDTAVDDAWGGDGGDARPCGEVVGVVKRGWRPYTCVIDMDSAIGNQYLAEPLDARIPRANWNRIQWDASDLDSFIEGLRGCGEVLAAGCPALEDNPNEIPNAPRIRSSV